MPLRVTRRPYTDCPYSWAISVSGISTGEGVVSEESCTGLNGDFTLDFSPCASKGGSLVWSGECIGPSDGGSSPCNVCETVLANNLPWTPPSVEYSDPNATVEWSSGFSGVLQWSAVFYDRDGVCEWSDFKRGVITTTTPDLVSFPPPDTLPISGERRYWYETSPGVFQTVILVRATLRRIGVDDPRIDIYSLLHDRGDPDPFSLTIFSDSVYRSSSCDSPAVFDESVSESTYLSQIDISGAVSVTYSAAGAGAGTGPETGDRIRSRWHLSYNIAETLWTLRSLERIDYPTYTLVDSDPCIGETKTLALADRGTLSDGCGDAPIEVTITRECPPDREANSGLLKDRRINSQTGKKKRHCSECDCQDEVDDKRYTCGTKCTDNTTAGCESYTEEEAPCLYPKTTACCDYCDGMDQPCAYIAEFECDIRNPDAIMSGYTVIAARQVTLRQECPFDNTCEWVAVGPSPNSEDGGVGAQPVCATCSGTCPETGCTWQSWAVGPCPDDGGVGCFVNPSIREYTGCYQCSELKYISDDSSVLADLPGAILHPTGSGYIWTGYEVLSGSLSGSEAFYELTMMKGLDASDYLFTQYCANLTVRVVAVGGYPQTHYYCLALRDVAIDGLGTPPHTATDPCGFPGPPDVEATPTIYSNITRLACP